MIFTGIVKSPFETGWFFIVDGYGNLVTLPTVSAFSLVFSVLNIIKTLISLNIVHIHVEVNIATFISQFNSLKIQLTIVKCSTYRESILQRISDCKSLRKLILLSLDHLPYFVSTTAFRLLSIIICITYLNVWTTIPLGIFWMTSLVMGYSR